MFLQSEKIDYFIERCIILTSNHKASRTYSAWQRVRSINAVEGCPEVRQASAQKQRLINNQPIKPGRSSQKNLRSNEPMRGFNSRPMKKSYAVHPKKEKGGY